MNFKLLLVIILFFVIQNSILFTNDLYDNRLPVQKTNSESELTITAKDSTYTIKLELIVQPRLIITKQTNGDKDFGAEALIRRLRLRFAGFIFDPSLTYFVHLGFSNIDMGTVPDSENEKTGPLFDAYLKWEFLDRTSVMFGQFKLPANLSRMMSFTSLNFLERSNAEKVFTPYRDIGFLFSNGWNIGAFNVREYLALTGGEGRNRLTADGGYCYTGRIEILPLGLFNNNGDCTEMDLEREETPKLLLGGAVSYNSDATRTHSTLGKDLYDSRNIITYTADVLFKYKGISFFVEYYGRNTNSPFTFSDDSTDIQFVSIGKGYSAQLSYMISDNYSLALRFSKVVPSFKILEHIDERTDFSIGAARYFSENKFKLQADLSYIREKIPMSNIDNRLQFRFNVLLII